MQESTVNIPFKIVHDIDGNGFSYIQDETLDGSCYAVSLNKAKQILRASIARQIREALEERQNCRRRIIGTNTEAVFIVEYKHGAWGYAICGPRRAHTCTNSSNDTFDETLNRARKHIDDCFGGIAWEHS